MKPRAKVRPTTPGRRFGSASRLPPAPGEPAHVAGARAAMMDRVRFQSSRAIYGAEGRQSSLTLDVGDVAVEGIVAEVRLTAQALQVLLVKVLRKLIISLDVHGVLAVLAELLGSVQGEDATSTAPTMLQDVSRPRLA